MARPDWKKGIVGEWDLLKTSMGSNVLECLDPVVKDLMGIMVSEYLDDLLYVVAVGESPIEQVMALALKERLDQTPLNFHIEPQAEYERYRLDLLLEIHSGNSCWNFAIECDGHDFHEKTKEQARRDKKRERALQAAGYTVIRFTGSEIWESPWKCAEEALKIVLEVIDNGPLKGGRI